ncbi:hypothetical protein J6590_024685 [Homalodisca vitripennis]|nr:hypothetical protein J6590_024685 [Homalodisca vitripennis]
MRLEHGESHVSSTTRLWKATGTAGGFGRAPATPGNYEIPEVIQGMIRMIECGKMKVTARSKKPTLRPNLGTNGFKVTSEPPPMARQAGCFNHARRYTRYTASLELSIMVFIEIDMLHQNVPGQVRKRSRTLRARSLDTAGGTEVHWLLVTTSRLNAWRRSSEWRLSWSLFLESTSSCRSGHVVTRTSGRRSNPVPLRSSRSPPASVSEAWNN